MVFWLLVSISWERSSDSRSSSAGGACRPRGSLHVPATERCGQTTRGVPLNCHEGEMRIWEKGKQRNSKVFQVQMEDLQWVTDVNSIFALVQEDLFARCRSSHGPSLGVVAPAGLPVVLGRRRSSGSGLGSRGASSLYRALVLQRRII